MNNVKPLAFYLPQFHRVKENDDWWGKGFTEWTNVARAKPNFKGHYQPHVPADLGFYDLNDVENMRDQADLAREHGIHGFCFYYYRFKDGRRILEKPLNNYVESNIDFPFCYCWANENWTKTWDGLDKEVLLEQNHGAKDDVDFLNELITVFKDKRYIKVDGKPMLLVYRADLLVDSISLTKRWREIAKEAGFPDLHLCAVQFYGIDNPSDYGFDAAVEFPPHKFIGPENRPDMAEEMTNPEFTGGIVDYRKVMSQAIRRTVPDYQCYRGIIPSWDNTARRQHTGHIFVNASPRLYQFWLAYLVDYTKKYFSTEQQFVFINAWNEWAEGAHLEPDLKNGSAYLEATLFALKEKKIDIKSVIINEDLLAFLTKNSSAEEIQMINDAIRLSYFSPENVKLNKNVLQNSCDFSNMRARDYIRINHPRVHKLILPIYKLVRKFR
ncbi:lipopolysaccharide biosynthesis protein [Pantoea sp. PA1]|jgi:lipopolysaccharide biosynthesis protein|nr:MULTISPECIES: glycoside hydrolase family 99-like domain-containing protein [Pantoea]MCS4496631.1 glycoside hydrolase family 99-like domain-containing protein [Pantoea sp. B623]MDH0052608.1 glycoside hydrolase family 99-like domain-containing protein [Pantoea ananatis]MDI3365323.1 glycoside hydrolase family 99-like domain-containing protein [Pantoea sp. V108_6]MDQ1226540.1 lipopolysaccharide biosynthesis protein [Pantoea ananatis]MDR6088418.1 lipopolysaccharide biosynthesis protein [Pantoea 